MKLLRRESLSELNQFSDERFLQSFTLFPKIGTDLTVDVYEENGNVIAKMSLPGMKPDEFDISLEDGMLTVSGKRKEEKMTDENGYYYKEIKRGSFSRSINLPKSVDALKAETTYEDGELVVTIPVAPGEKVKAVKVKAVKVKIKK